MTLIKHQTNVSKDKKFVPFEKFVVIIMFIQTQLTYEESEWDQFQLCAKSTITAKHVAISSKKNAKCQLAR